MTENRDQINLERIDSGYDLFIQENVSSVDVIHDLPEEEKLCQCGCMKSRPHRIYCKNA